MISFIDNAMKNIGLENYRVLKIEDTYRYLNDETKALGYNSVIIFTLPYFAGNEKGNISLYARGWDYHKVMGDIQKRIAKFLLEKYKDAEFAFYSDISPYKESALAAAAGLGVLGLNNLLITEKYGSFVFIGEVLTTIGFERFDELSDIKFCDKCGKCKTACFSGALNREFNKDLCISYITQKKGDLTKEEQNLIIKSPYIWGCDLCQLACPLNQNISKTHLKEFNENLILNLGLKDIMDLSNRAFLKKYKDSAFKWRGISPLKRNLGLKSKSS